MNPEELFSEDIPKLKCVGTGLVTLDIVSKANNGLNLKFWMGGSCGNVLIILSYLGWESCPVVRLGDDSAGRFLIKEMKSFELKCDLVSLSKSASTPIIVEEISNGVHGNPLHRWKWTCPICGSKLPVYKPFPAREIAAVSAKIPESNVFYFDRVSRAAVELAQCCKSRGAIVFFEPSMIGNKELFNKCLEVADIVKYSHSQAANFSKLLNNFMIPLEVETMGANGLRYRAGTSSPKNNWIEMPGYRLQDFKDSAGCGDWCSAGIMHTLGVLKITNIHEVSNQAIEHAVKFGQTLAAIKCSFEGARGLMYSVTRERLAELVKQIWDSSNIQTVLPSSLYTTPSEGLHLICPNCHRTSGK
jgi:fructokinase